MKWTMHRSFRPSDFKWRETPWIVLGIVGYSLLISGFWGLLNSYGRWQWQFAVAFPCLAVLVAR
jgi:hypothetical protein